MQTFLPQLAFSSNASGTLRDTRRRSICVPISLPVIVFNCDEISCLAQPCLADAWHTLPVLQHRLREQPTNDFG